MSALITSVKLSPLLIAFLFGASAMGSSACMQHMRMRMKGAPQDCLNGRVDCPLRPSFPCGAAVRSPLRGAAAAPC